MTDEATIHAHPFAVEIASKFSPGKVIELPNGLQLAVSDVHGPLIILVPITLAESDRLCGLLAPSPIVSLTN